MSLQAKVENIQKQGKMFPIILSYHASAVNLIRFNKDGTLFMSAGNDKKINIFNAQSFQRLGTVTTNESLKSFEITKDSEYIVSGGFVGSVGIHRVTDGNLMGDFTFDLKIKSVEFSYGDEYILFLGDKFSDYTKSMIYVFKWSDLLNKVLNKKDITENDALYSREFDNGMLCKGKFGLMDNRIYFATETGYIKIISLDLREILFEEKVANKEVMCLNFSQRYEFLIMTHWDGYKILDPQNLKTISSYKTIFPMNCAQVSPLMDGDQIKKPHILMGGGVQARDIALAKINMVYGKLLAELRGHYGPVNWIEWFRDGRGFVSAGEEGIVRVYRFDNLYFTDEKFEHTNHF